MQRSISGSLKAALEDQLEQEQLFERLTAENQQLKTELVGWELAWPGRRRVSDPHARSRHPHGLLPGGILGPPSRVTVVIRCIPLLTAGIRARRPTLPQSQSNRRRMTPRGRAPRPATAGQAR